MPTRPSDTSRWLLLIYSLAPKPDYLRVKVRRRLQRIGAAPLKNSVYVLPNDEASLEDFTWLAREIEGDGGSAIICVAQIVDGISDEEIQKLLATESSSAPRTQSRIAHAGPDHVKSGRTWVTRKGVGIDRIASSWLIRRAIDPRPKFKFVAARGYHPAPGELRFDMFEAEYTHVGDACTFQSLLGRFQLTNRAYRIIGEIVHDIDCKDEKFGRPETSGVARIIRGIVEAHAGDRERIARGGAVFDDLYSSFSKTKG